MQHFLWMIFIFPYNTLVRTNVLYSLLDDARDDGLEIVRNT